MSGNNNSADTAGAVRNGSTREQSSFIAIDYVCGNSGSVWTRSLYRHIIVACHFVHRKWNFTGCCMIENHGEALLPTLHLFVIVDEKSTVSIPYKTTERFTPANSFVLRYMLIKPLLSVVTSPTV